MTIPKCFVLYQYLGVRNRVSFINLDIAIALSETAIRNGSASRRALSEFCRRVGIAHHNTYRCGQL